MISFIIGFSILLVIGYFIALIFICVEYSNLPTFVKERNDSGFSRSERMHYLVEFKDKTVKILLWPIMPFIIVYEVFSLFLSIRREIKKLANYEKMSKALK